MSVRAHLDRKSLIAAGLFVLFVLVLEALFFSTYRDYLLKTYGFSDIRVQSLKYYALFLFGYFFSAFLLFIFVYLSIVSAPLFRAFYFAVFSATVLFEFTYQNLFGRFSTIQDLSLAMITTPAQKLDAVLSYTNPVALIPCLAYLIVLVAVRGREKVSIKKSASALGIFIFVLISFNFSMWVFAPRFYFYESANNSFGAGSRTFFGYVFSEAWPVKNVREAVQKPAGEFTPDNNIVLVLDESVRGDHLSLNGYPRQTTPFLDELAARGLLKNWGIASSESTRSFESYQYLITGISPATDEPADARTRPTIFQYAKARNYRTFYLDGQMNDYWAGDSSDLREIDVLLGKKYFDPSNKSIWQTDLKIAAKVKEITENSAGNFIVIFKRGTHTPYNNSFPPAEAVWLPTAAEYIHSVFDADRETFINTYDNAIRFNLNEFFRALTADYVDPPNSTVILYTSDHGQTLNENGEEYSHGGVSRNEANVPLFMLGKLPKTVDIEFRASHANIFSTLLDLMQFPAEYRNHRYAVSLLDATAADSTDRYFFTPTGGPGNVKIAVDQRIKFDQDR